MLVLILPSLREPVLSDELTVDVLKVLRLSYQKAKGMSL